MAYNYTSFYRNLNVTSDELIAEFERRRVVVPASLTDLREHGCRYAHHDFDVIGHAIRELAGGNDFEHVYAEIFERRQIPFNYLDIVEGGGVPDWRTDDGDYGCGDSPETNDEGTGGHYPRKCGKFA